MLGKIPNGLENALKALPPTRGFVPEVSSLNRHALSIADPVTFPITYSAPLTMVVLAHGEMNSTCGRAAPGGSDPKSKRFIRTTATTANSNNILNPYTFINRLILAYGLPGCLIGVGEAVQLIEYFQTKHNESLELMLKIFPHTPSGSCIDLDYTYKNTKIFYKMSTIERTIAAVERIIELESELKLRRAKIKKTMENYSRFKSITDEIKLLVNNLELYTYALNIIAYDPNLADTTIAHTLKFVKRSEYSLYENAGVHLSFADKDGHIYRRRLEYSEMVNIAYMYEGHKDRFPMMPRDKLDHLIYSGGTMQYDEFLPYLINCALNLGFTSINPSFIGCGSLMLPEQKIENYELTLESIKYLKSVLLKNLPNVIRYNEGELSMVLYNQHKNLLKRKANGLNSRRLTKKRRGKSNSNNNSNNI